MAVPNPIVQRFPRVLALLAAMVATGACTLDVNGHGEVYNLCGNGVIDEPEECDTDRFGDKTCLDFEFTHGRLLCDSTCHIDRAQCHTCGNGVREGSEDCDGADLAGQDCMSALGFKSGELGCTDQCRWDVWNCHTCGNAVIEADEECDEFVEGVHTCETETGHASGKLFCSSSCTIDPTQCYTCGDGELDGPEKCDGENLADMDCQKMGFSAGTLACDDVTCQFDTSGCFNPPADWFDTDWLYRRQVVVEKDLVDADLSSFPMLVSLTEPELADHAVSPRDFVFTDSDGVTVLPYEVEFWDSAHGHLVAWVRVPHLISTIDTKLYVYFGNPLPPLPPDAGKVWADGYAAVWHLNDVAVDEGSSALHADAATGLHGGTQAGNHDVEGKINRAQSFDGIDDYVEFSGPDGIVLGDADCTISAWIRTTSTSTISLLRKAPDTHEDGDKLWGLEGGVFAVEHGAVGTLASTNQVNDGEWHHVAWTQRKDVNDDAEAWVMYVDGVEDETAEYETLPDIAGHPLRLGDLTLASTFPSRWAGEVDELRISHVVRSAAWISTSYLNQYAPETFFTLGNEETIAPAQ